MVGKTNVAGARLHSVIAVTYPEGSVCSCTNGTKTLKAKDTSGKALFNVSAGEWTVTATDGNKTKSATVSITQEAQSESVTLSYWNGEFYERGNQYTNITGGWQKTGAGTFSLNTSDMIIGPANYGSNVRGTTKNKVDISGYSSLKFTYTCTNGAAYVRAGIASTTTPSDSGGWVSYVGLSTTSSEKVTTLDVSAQTGSYYIVVSTFTGDSGGATINIKKVQGV